MSKKTTFKFSFIISTIQMSIGMITKTPVMCFSPFPLKFFRGKINTNILKLIVFLFGRYKYLYYLCTIKIRDTTIKK